MRRIGVIMSIGEDAEGLRRISAIRQGLQQLGWSEGPLYRVLMQWQLFSFTTGICARHQPFVDRMIIKWIVGTGTGFFCDSLITPPNKAPSDGRDRCRLGGNVSLCGPKKAERPILL